MDLKVQIPHLELQSEIASGSFGAVYLAKGQDGQLFAVKVQRSQTTSQTELSQFRQESIVNASLNHPNVLKCYEMGEVEHRGYLVMEYFKSQTLSVVLKQGALPEAKLVDIAKQITEAVSFIHSHGYVHRDLKPDNILVNEEGKIKVIDFGFAVQNATKKTDTSQAVGTFLYCSPEQAGVTQQPVDFRSDLYSLGCILYQCATGEVPFFSEDLGTLLRKLATEPVPDPQALNPSLSLGMARVIQKLLSKDVDERYLNAEGLLHDLKRLPDLNHALKSNRAINLGFIGDQPILSRELPILGREQELLSLESVWDEVSNGKGQTVLIEAPSGMGKSRLLREFGLRFDGKNALVLRGAFQRDAVSFAALFESIDQYLMQIRRLDAALQAQIADRWKKAAGSSASILGSLSLVFRSFFNDSPEKTEIPEQNVLYEILAKFLILISKEYSGLIVILENIHWIDAQTQEVLKRVQRDYSSHRVLILGSAQTGEGDVWKALLPENSQNISLGLLSKESCCALFRTHLGDRELQDDLLDYLLSTSQGNPLTLTEYLKIMLEQGLVQVSSGVWKGELKSLQTISLGTNVADLLLRRLSKLSAQGRETLQIGAVFGFQFNQEHLSRLVNRDIGEDLSEASFAHVIELRGQKRSQFSHVSIRDKLLEELSLEKKQELHQKIAEYLEQLPNEEKDSEEFIYALADHYTSGTLNKNLRRIHEIQFQAGTLAFQAWKTEEAKKYLLASEQTALAHQLSVDLVPVYLSLSEVLLRIPNEAENGLNCTEKALVLCTDPVVRADIYTRMGPFVFSQKRFDKYSLFTHSGFKELGIKIPKTKLGLIGWTLYRAFIAWILYRTGWLFGSKPQKEGGKKLHILIWLHLAATQCAITDGQAVVGVYHFISVVYFSHFLGNSIHLLSAYAGLLSFAASVGLWPLALKFRETQINLLKNWKKPGWDVAYHIHFLDSLASFAPPSALTYIEVKKQLRMLVEHSSQLLPLTTIEVAIKFRWPSILRGYFKDTQWVIDFYENRNPHPATTSQCALWRAAILAQRGEIAEAFSYLPKDPPLALKTQDYETAFCVLSVYLESQEWSEAEKWIQSILSIHFKKRHRIWVLNFALLLSFHIYAEQGIEDHSKRLLAGSFIGTTGAQSRKIEPLYPHFLVTDGIIEFWKGKLKKAVRLLDNAERKSILHDNPLARYYACLYRARVFLEWSEKSGKRPDLQARYKEAAAVDAQTAFGLATRHQWVMKARKVRAEFKLDEASSHSESQSSSERSVRASTVSQTRATSTETVKLKKYLEALLSLNQVSSEFSGEASSAESYVNAALDQSLRILNAERALLFLGEVNSTSQPQFMRAIKSRETQINSGFSRSHLKKVIDTRKPKVYTGEENQSTSTSSSVMLNNLKSMMIAPLLKDDQCLGAIYLDSSLARGIFSNDDLDILMAIASHIAINFEAARTKALELEKKELEKDLEVKKKIQTAYEALEKATRNIRTIFATINQGIFTLDQDMRIQGDYSSQLESILGEKDLAGKSLSDLLWKQSSIDSDLENRIKTTCSVSIGESLFNYEFNASNFPREFYRKLSNGKVQYFEMDWAPLVDSSDLVQGLMVTLRDVSLLRDLKQQAEESHAELKIIHQLLNIAPSTTVAYFENSEKLLSSNEKLLGSLQAIQPDDQAYLFRNLHTLKGNSRSYNLDLVSNCVHEVEEILKTRDVDQLRKGHREIRSQLANYQRIFREKLSRTGNDSSLGVDGKRLDSILETAQHLAKQERPDPKELEALMRAFIELKKLPLQPLFTTIEETAKSIAKELGKSPPKLVYQGEPLSLEPSQSQLFVSVLNHLVRNSIDHGFDTDLVEPQISVECKKEGRTLTFRYSDNGKGLNLKKIREKGRERNLVAEGASPDAIADLIFLSGFSSRDQVTQISGRGVGMDAVREMLKELGGHTSIKLLTPENTSGFSKFEIHFGFLE